MNKRVVITGLGIVCPSGTGKDEFWKNTTAGVNCIAPITRFDAAHHYSRMAAEIRDFTPGRFMDRQQIRRTDLSVQYAIAAGRMALEDAAVRTEKFDPERIGVVMGTASSGIAFMEAEAERYFAAKNPSSISPFLVLGYFGCSALGQMSIQLGNLKGYGNTIATGCTAGTVAIGDGFRAIQRGDADMILAGGTDASITPIAVQAFGAMKALSSRNHDPAKASRPFDRSRDGFVISEGAAVVILEELSHAVARGAKIYAEVAGYGNTSNGHHMTVPVPDGRQLARAIRQAMDEGGIDSVDYISVHGSSTPLNEPAETAGIKRAFPAKTPPVSSLKSMIGHALGGSGAIQAVANCMVLETGILPPTINFEEEDPSCLIDCVPNTARRLPEVTAVLQNASGFSGVNATLLLKKYCYEHSLT